MFLSFALTTKFFLCTENSVSYICIDKKVFPVYREQCLFRLPRQRSVYSAQKTVFLSFALTTKHFLCIENSVSFAQTTVFLSFAQTTKCFLYIENIISFLCTDNKMPALHRKQCFFHLHRQESVYSGTENSISFICIDKKVFLVHRTVFLSLA